jgi:hypothetical protein
MSNKNNGVSQCETLQRFGKCCCTCHNHVPDHHHPMTTGKSVMEARGWICFVPEEKMAFSGWVEHGFCELHNGGLV